VQRPTQLRKPSPLTTFDVRPSEAPASSTAGPKKSLDPKGRLKSKTNDHPSTGNEEEDSPPKGKEWQSEK